MTNRLINEETLRIMCEIDGKKSISKISRINGKRFGFTSLVLNYLMDIKLISFKIVKNSKIPILLDNGEKVLLSLLNIKMIIKESNIGDICL